MGSVREEREGFQNTQWRPIVRAAVVTIKNDVKTCTDMTLVNGLICSHFSSCKQI